MSSTDEGGRSSIKALVIVLSVVGGLVLLGVLGCVGLIFWGLRTVATELPVAQAAATAFLDDVNAGRLDEAYDRTSHGFRSALSREQFEAFVARFPVLRKYTSRSFTGFHIHQQPGQRVATFKVTVLSPDSSLSFTLVLVPEAEEWKVQGLTVP